MHKSGTSVINDLKRNSFDIGLIYLTVLFHPVLF